VRGRLRPKAPPAGSGFVVRILTVGSRLTFHVLRRQTCPQQGQACRSPRGCDARGPRGQAI